MPNLKQHLSTGKLLAWARLGKADAQFVPIAPSKWTGVVKFAKSAGSKEPQVTCGALPLFSAEVFPVLLAPNVIEHLGYISLKAVFNDFVIGDPEVQHLGSSAIEKAPKLAELYRGGRRYWPLDAEELRSIGEPDEFAEQWLRHYVSTSETDLAQRALRSRYLAMLNLLRSRCFVAQGDPVRPNDPQEILSSIWESPTYSFDSHSGDVVQDRDWGDEEVEVFRFGDGRENYVTRWRAVLIRPANSSVNDHKADETLASSTKRKGKMTTEEKFESCLEFLKMRMSESPKIRPKAKRLVWLDARKHCSTNIIAVGPQLVMQRARAFQLSA